jgi:NAD(P)-dependent dehydrogenase (short-subunit alcohol dehydrogenase family)
MVVTSWSSTCTCKSYAPRTSGMFLVTRALLPLLWRSPAGRIVNVASTVIWLGPPRMVACTTS